MVGRLELELWIDGGGEEEEEEEEREGGGAGRGEEEEEERRRRGKSRSGGQLLLFAVLPFAHNIPISKLVLGFMFFPFAFPFLPYRYRYSCRPVIFYFTT